MPVACSSGRNFANQKAARSGARLARSGSVNFSIINKIKTMYGEPHAILPQWLGVSKRTAARKLRGQRVLNVEEVGRLIRSERGFEIIAAIMTGHSPQWWRICKPLMDAADVRKMQMQAQKRIQKILGEVVDADQSLSLAIARSDALAVHTADHGRALHDEFRALADAPLDRAMAAKPKR